MRAFHNSRDISYRKPYGAVTPGTAVTLSIDVMGAPDAVVQLRTWFDGVGESLYAMSAIGDVSALCASDDPAGAEGSAGSGDPSVEHGSPNDAEATRYQVTITPEAAGIMWYHFIITDAQGTAKRYGATPGRVGGEGRMADWEPPSFQLSVHVPHDMPPAWHEVIGAYLYNENAVRTLEEIVETTRENFPFSLYQSAYPWQAGTMQATPPWSPWPALSCSAPLNPDETGDRFPCFAVNDDVFGFWSRDDAGSPLCMLVNTSLRNAQDVAVAMVADEVSELVGGYGVRVVGASELQALRCNDTFNFNDAKAQDDDASSEGKPAEIDAKGTGSEKASGAYANGPDDANAPQCTDRFAHVHLNPLGTCLLHFHATERLQRPMEPGIGVLAHITSLPAEGEGTLGAPARAFVDWLAQAGVRYWQVLPVNPTDEFGSPYAGLSAFAGNVRLLEGSGVAFSDATPTPRAKARIAKLKKYQAFCERESYWLEPYAAFMAIRQKLGEKLAWQEWPKKYRRFNPKLIAGDEELAASAEAWRQSQYLFEQQWKDLRAYANERGVLIVGDMPIYVSADSADVWAHPGIFQLGEDGLPMAVAGCAPDAFAVDGQIWGNPLYDWGACKADGYTWWLRRLQRAFELYDVVRLDHFIGFSRYYSIPAGQTAAMGTYFPGPGIELFQRAYGQFGPLPVIAEDLGLITPAVRALSASCGFPGMDIAQFVDGNDPLSGYRPRPDKIAYTGTHDNQTLVGYCRQRYPHIDGREAAADIMEKVASCSAPICVVPLQDLMGLGDEARMNVPGVAEGNWSWQADAVGMPAALEQVEKLVALHKGNRIDS